MAIVRDLLQRGNTKLGEAVHTWSLPAVVTCPGRSALCEHHCYARSGRFRTHALQFVLARNLLVSGRDDFDDLVAREVRRRGVHVVRVHVSGDFYSPEYVAKWVRVARRSRRATFYAYTRSWRVGEIAPALAELAALPNVRLWYSCDAETELPAFVPRGVRLCYLQDQHTDVPDGTALVFRVRRLRPVRPTRVILPLVCPTEKPGRGDQTCSECQRCWRDER